MALSQLPSLNACLNALCAVFLTLGFFFIRSGKIKLHRLSMTAAFVTSVVFLTSYLIYHYHVGSVRFQGVGWIRTVYFAILISHTILATLIVPLVLRTLYLAVRKRFESHRKWARWTWPLWMYVSVTGVVVYWMLYH